MSLPKSDHDVLILTKGQLRELINDVEGAALAATDEEFDVLLDSSSLMKIKELNLLHVLYPKSVFYRFPLEG